MEAIKGKNKVNKHKLYKLAKLAISYLILLLMVTFVLIPVAYVISGSLEGSDVTTLGNLIPQKFTLENYTKIFKGTERFDFLLAFLNSLYVVVPTLLLTFVFGVLAAYAFSRFDLRGKDFFIKFLISMGAFPSLLGLPAFIMLFRYTSYTGLDLRGSLEQLIIINIGFQMIIVMLNMKGYFDTISYEIEESAFLDGARPFIVFTKIILPLSKPSIAVTIILVFLAVWTEYGMASALVTDQYLRTLPVALNALQESNYRTNWPQFAAGAVITAAPVVVIFFWAQKYFISGLTIGSEK